MQRPTTVSNKILSKYRIGALPITLLMPLMCHELIGIVFPEYPNFVTICSDT